MHFWCRAAATLTLSVDFFTLRGLSRLPPAPFAGAPNESEAGLSPFGDVSMSFMQFGHRRSVVLALGMIMAACATSSISPSTSPEAKRTAVLKRADARGAALVRGDLDAAYAFLSEGSKAVISQDNFKRRMSMVPFTAYRIDTAACEAESCTVHSKLTYDHRVMKGVTTPITETWVVERGDLFFVFPQL
jgi:hypothetical protein